MNIFSRGKAGKTWKKQHCEPFVWLFGNFYRVLWKRYAQKLCNIVLLQFELITFRFHYWNTLKPIIFMISGFSDVSLSPKTIHFYLWRDQIPPNKSRNPKSFFGNIISLNITIWVSKMLKLVEKAGAGNHADPSNCFWKSCIWDQYLPENMKREFCNMVSLNLRTETKKL